MRKLIVYLVTCKRWQGKLMHRTEPFDNTDFERVLASFSFCTASSLHCNHLADLVQVLKDQTPAFYVSPQGQQGQLPPQPLSYEEAREAVLAAGISDYHAFWHWSRGLPRKARMPLHPHKHYARAGWVSWDHFFHRTSPGNTLPASPNSA